MAVLNRRLPRAMNPIYLDNSATTPLLPAAWEAMRPYFIDHFGNPASSHRYGRNARRALEFARECIARLVDADPENVLFTSGATEANNLAIFGLCGDKPGRLITSPIEHPCVAEPLSELSKHGFSRSFLKVSGSGVVQPEADAISNDARLLTVMLANHETGALQPISQLTQLTAGRVPFHCDAAAAGGKIPISLKKLGVTSLTLSAHKFHGPQGVGALVLKKHTKLRPLFWGGHQQQGKRPGTESVALAVGMATALEHAMREFEVRYRKVTDLRDRFLKVLRQQAAPVVLNGPEGGGLPYVVNLSFPGCAADLLHIKLDLAGIACSTGSACSSGSLLPSPVLQAMGVGDDVLRSAIRFSFHSSQ